MSIKVARNILVSSIASLLLLPAGAAFAKEPPAMIFVKAKCALCHGANGSGDTPAGKQSGVKDFRLTEVQSQTDEELATIIANGKGKMPAFGARLDNEEITMMVRYVRELSVK